MRALTYRAAPWGGTPSLELRNEEGIREFRLVSYLQLSPLGEIEVDEEFIAAELGSASPGIDEGELHIRTGVEEDILSALVADTSGDSHARPSVLLTAERLDRLRELLERLRQVLDTPVAVVVPLRLVREGSSPTGMVDRVVVHHNSLSVAGPEAPTSVLPDAIVEGTADTPSTSLGGTPAECGPTTPEAGPHNPHKGDPR